MARLGGRSSESLLTPAAGLASILRENKARSNVLLGTLAQQPPSIVSSPESSVSESDIGEEDPDELKEEDVWATETRLRQQEASKTENREVNGSLYPESTLTPGFNKQNPGVSAKSLGLGSGFGMVDGSMPDRLGAGSRAKKRENGAMREVVSGLGRQKTNAGEVVRSSSSRQGRGPSVVDDDFGNGGLSRHTRPLESSPSSFVKSPSCRSSASWMIPQLGGVSKHSSRRHAERQSAPVQVPDWSKFMAKHKGKAVATMNDCKGEEDDDDDRLPPHELLAREYARSQRTTFSVCEGQGRTLKGRDLSRVRDAVWSQMGFAD